MFDIISKQLSFFGEVKNYQTYVESKPINIWAEDETKNLLSNSLQFDIL